MADLWRFLSGEIPGGIAALLVLVIAFLFVWEFLFRIGSELSRRTYRRGRVMVPLIMIAVYGVFWLQTPPRPDPLRIAVLFDKSTEYSDWRHYALADLTARRLPRSLPTAIVNPWAGLADDYPEPSPEILTQAKYRVFRFTSKDTSEFQLAKGSAGDKHFTVDLTAGTLWQNSYTAANWILQQLHQKAEVAAAFREEPSAELLESYYRGYCATVSGNSDEASVWLRQALDLDSTFIPAQILTAYWFERQGDWRCAASLLRDAALADTSSTEAWLALGELLIRNREWDQAEAALKMVLSKHLEQVRAYVGLAQIHPQRLKGYCWNSPEALLEEAIHLDPAYESARLRLASLWLEIGSDTKACRLLKDGLELNPGSTSLLLKLGAAELHSGSPSGARKAYASILQREPDHADVLFNLGVVDYRTKRYSRALEYFERSSKRNGPVDSYFYMGRIHQINGDLEKAKIAFMKRWELRKDNRDIFALKAKEMAEALAQDSDEQAP
ncbi:MAG: tetratricopeptide repeat protein [bacterium]